MALVKIVADFFLFTILRSEVTSVNKSFSVKQLEEITLVPKFS